MSPETESRQTESVSERRRVAKERPDEHRNILGATPYSLSHGMISLRIRAGEDRQTIFTKCCTSVEMPARLFLRDRGPRRQRPTGGRGRAHPWQPPLTDRSCQLRAYHGSLPQI